ncbi:hypothetical protein [Streptococcus suis]|uniref:hypothetical protein n=1 Tax=Streptococcus suis TaxID=1307 RepID=UPI001ABE2FB1|nr:hypothetical protein [Streptococcus suis]
MLKKMISDWRLRNLLFLVMAIIPVIPFLLYRRFQMDWDAWFHFSRMYEIVQNISHGKFALDISYFSFNNQGYAVNFFYPYFINYPVALVWYLTGSPVFSVLLWNIVFHLIGLNIAYHAYDKWQKKPYFAFLFSVLYIFGYSVVNVRMLNMGTYNAQITYMFLPYAIIGIYQLIFGRAREWRLVTIFAIIIITLSHLLTTVLLVFYSAVLFAVLLVNKRKLLIKERLYVWVQVIASVILSTAIFVFPMLEQKVANDWIHVPAMNLSSNGIVDSSVDNLTWLKRLESAVSFREVLILLFITTLFCLLYYRVFNRKLQKLIFGIITISILQSHLVPWYFLQRLSVVDMFQNLNRLDSFLFFAISLFIAFGWQNILLTEPKRFTNKHFFVASSILYLLFLSQNFYQQKNGITTSNLSDFDRNSYLATDDTIYKGLENSNFGYFSSWAGKGWYRINGFMDYRTEGQIRRTQNADGTYTIDDGMYTILNGESNRPLYNVSKDTEVETNDIIENAVYFDGERTLNKFLQKDFSFFINDIPSSTKIIQAPITYLKGFVVKDDSGNILTSYKNKKGWLEFKISGSSQVVITYEKTLLHKFSIGISILTWLVIGVLHMKLRKK